MFVIYRRILIDAGAEKTSPEYCELLKEALEKFGCEISNILVTHGHEDHFGGVPAILELCRTRKFHSIIQPLQRSVTLTTLAFYSWSRDSNSS